MCALSILLSTAPRLSLQGCQAKACLGCPETLVPSSVTVPTSRDRRPRSTAVAASPPNQAHRGQPAACALERFGSSCRFGHFDSCAGQASPCFPSCTCLRSRDTRTQERGPGQVWTRYQKFDRGGAPTCLAQSFTMCNLALRWDHERLWPSSVLCIVPCPALHHRLGFAVNPARSC